MPRIARLPDGRQLRFPDGTADDVMDRAVGENLGAMAPADVSPTVEELRNVDAPEERAQRTYPARMTLTRGGQPVVEKAPLAPAPFSETEVAKRAAALPDDELAKLAKRDEGVNRIAREVQTDRTGRAAIESFTATPPPTPSVKEITGRAIDTVSSEQDAADKAPSSFMQTVESIPARMSAGRTVAFSNTVRAASNVDQRIEDMQRFKADVAAGKVQEGMERAYPTIDRPTRKALQANPGEIDRKLAELTQFKTGAVDQIESAQADMRKARPKNAGVLDTIVGGAAESLPPTLAGMAAGILTRSPAVGMTVGFGGGSVEQGAQAFHETLSSGDEAGKRMADWGTLHPSQREQYLRGVMSDEASNAPFKRSAGKVLETLGQIKDKQTLGMISPSAAGQMTERAFGSFARDIGHIKENATLGSAKVGMFVQGLAEGLGEALPIGVALKKGTPLWTRMFNSIAVEFTQEFATRVMQTTDDWIRYDPTMTIGEMLKQSFIAGASGAVMGGVIGPIGAAANWSAQRNQPSEKDRRGKLIGDQIDLGVKNTEFVPGSADAEARARMDPSNAQMERTGAPPARPRAGTPGDFAEFMASNTKTPQEHAAKRAAAGVEEMAPTVQAATAAAEEQAVTEGEAGRIAAEAAGIPAKGERATFTWAGGDVDNVTILEARPDGALIELENGGTLDVTTADGTFGPAPLGAGTPESPVVVARPEDVEQASKRVDTAPTEAQKEAGNYAKGHIDLQGLNISIENPKGSERSGTGPEGPWTVTMPAHYGYIKRTKGADDEQVDVYVGDVPTSQQVWVVDQIDPRTGNFDEHKVMLGLPTAVAAKNAYFGGFSDGSGPQRMGAMTHMSVDQFKEWLKNGNNTKPVAYVKPKPKEQDNAIRPVQEGPKQPQPQAGAEVRPVDETGTPRPAGAPQPVQQGETGPGPGSDGSGSTQPVREPVADKRIGQLYSFKMNGKTHRGRFMHTVHEGQGARIAMGEGPLPGPGSTHAYTDVPLTKLTRINFDLTDMTPPAEPPKKPVTPQVPAMPGMTPLGRPATGGESIGKNADGQEIFEDARGVRSIVENGVRVSQKVEMVPTRGAGGKVVYETRPMPEDRFEPVAKQPAEEPKAAPTDKYTQADIADLVRQIEGGKMLLFGGNDVGLPTIQSVKGAQHMGYGMFKATTPEYEVTFDGGNSMSRTPSGQPYTVVGVSRGTFPYDKAGVLATLRNLSAAVDLLSGRDGKLPNQPAPEKPAEPPAVKPETLPQPGFGKTNTVFTEDKAAAARELLRKKLGGINVGLDPEVVQAGIQLAGYYIEGGARSFAAYSAKMIADLGDSVRPYLKGWYAALYYGPEISDKTGMDEPGTIKEAPAAAPQPEKPASTGPQEATNAAETGITVTATKNTKTGEAIWVAKIPARVDRAEYEQIKARAKAAGGYWSKFAKGFIFKDAASANRFAGIAPTTGTAMVPVDNYSDVQKDADVEADAPREQIDARDLNGPEGWVDLGYIQTKDGVMRDVHLREIKTVGKTGNKSAVRQIRIYDGNHGSHMATWEWRATSLGALPELTIDLAVFHYVLSNETEEAFGEDASDGDALWAEYGPEILEMVRDMPATTQEPGERPSGLLAAPKKEASPAMRLANRIKVEVIEAKNGINNPRLMQMAREEWGGTEFSPKEVYDAVEAGMNLWLRENTDLSDTNQAATVDEAISTIKALREATSHLPTQNVRDKEQDEFQQFSTPPAIAWLLNWVANVRRGETGLEPSGGLGGIAVFAEASGVKMIINELSDRRAAVLKDLFPDARIFTEDASQINNILPDDVKPTVVLMNPPFSATAGRIEGRRSNKEGLKHIDQALKRLEPGGRLSLLMGEGMALDLPGQREWWDSIRAEYSIRANIGIDGSAYMKYGTTFGVQLIVIDKTGPTTQAVVVAKDLQPEDVPALLEGIRNDRPESRAASEQRPAQPSSGQVPAKAPAQQGEAQRPRPGSVGTDARPGDQAPKPKPPVAAGSGATAGNAGPPAASGSPTVRGGSGRGEGAAPSGPVEPDGQAGGVEPAPSDSVQQHGGESGLNIESQASAKAEGELTDSVYETYTPKRLKIPGAQPHPGKLVESAAMSAVDPPAPTYTPNLPREVIEKGMLSIAQLEAVVYAGQAHSQLLPGTAAQQERRGFFIGDGTGVGKGREIGGIILDNIRQGRKKAVWVSEKQGLHRDAQRDFDGVGGNPATIFKHSGTAAKNKITAKAGILFTTYSMLRSGEKRQANAVTLPDGTKVTTDAGQSRVDQLVEWLGEDFDGALVFDEAHNMANAVQQRGARGVKKPSAMAIAALNLQARLPLARVVYVSATGATEVQNLAYAARLGLWGEGTPFASRAEFINQISAGGVAVMELVAQNMKALGVYMSRSLSYDGVTYDRLEHTLEPIQHELYNRLADTWQGVLRHIGAALETTGQAESGQAKGAALSRFWGAHQRFFNQIITAMQMPTIIANAKAALEAGDAVVMQLVNTNEAEQERQAARAEVEGEELEELEFGPMDSLIEFVTSGFPVQQYVQQDDGNGNVISVPAVDGAGNPIINRDAVAARDALIAELQAMKRSSAIPGNPIDLVLEEFGPDNVAEITGRKRRFIRIKGEAGEYEMTEQKRGAAAAQNDAKDFMDDKKRVLIFSDAGGTGFSFQSDLNVKNQRMRHHYLVQPGWRADKAVQGFGRTHRTNEANQPKYLLPTTNLKAQKRFISSVARRLDQLGALTKGQRQTGSQGLFSAKDNLESQYSTAAVTTLFEDMHRGNTPLDFTATVAEMGLTDIVDPRTNALNKDKIPTVPRFLNRLLSLRVETQDAVFEEFIRRMEEAVETAINQGRYNDGMETVRAQKVQIERQETVHVDERSGAETKYYDLKLTHPTTINDFDKVQKAIEDEVNATPAGVTGREHFYFRNEKSGNVFAIIDRGQRVGADGHPVTRGSRWGVTGNPRYVDNVEGVKSGSTGYGKNEITYTRLTEAEAKVAWGKELAKTPTTYSDHLHMIAGALLPVWNRITGDSARVVRTQTEDGTRIIGRVVPVAQLTDTLRNLGVGSTVSKLPAAEVFKRIMDGERGLMADGSTLVSVKVLSTQRMELSFPRNNMTPSRSRQLTNQGAQIERHQWVERAFIPNAAVLERILETTPIVELQSDEDEGGEKFSLGDTVDQTETPAFLKWFGESKVVDADGRPLRVYHGTPANKNFSVFKPMSHFGTAEQANSIVEGFRIFAQPPGNSKRVMPVYLHIENPLYIHDTGAQHDAHSLVEAISDAGGLEFNQRENILYDENSDRRTDAKMQELLLEELERNGYDGLIYENRIEGEGGSYVAFRPEQIKSAIGNRGTFDESNPDIRYGLGTAEQEDENALDDRIDPAVAAKVAEIAKQLAPSANLAMVDHYFASGEGLVKSGAKSTKMRLVAGSYSSLRQLITIAMNYKGGRNGGDPTSTIRHEVVHALKDMGMFTPAEWTVLEREAEARWKRQYRVPDNEESIAYAFQHYRATGMPTGGLVGKAFARIAEFFERLGNALRGLGFQSVESIFKSIESGKVGGSVRKGSEADLASMTLESYRAMPESFRKAVRADLDAVLGKVAEAEKLSLAPGFTFDAKESPLYKTRPDVKQRPAAEVSKALEGDATAKRIMAKGITPKAGEPVGARLNINVMKTTGVAVQSLHRGRAGEGHTQNKGFWTGEVIGYAPVVTLKDAYLNVHQATREKIARGESSKMPMASVDGKYVAGAGSFDGVEFRFNPKREHLFIDALGRVLRHADEVTIHGNSVYARGSIEYYGAEDVPARAGDAPTDGRLMDPSAPAGSLGAEKFSLGADLPDNITVLNKQSSTDIDPFRRFFWNPRNAFKDHPTLSALQQFATEIETSIARTASNLTDEYNEIRGRFKKDKAGWTALTDALWLGDADGHEFTEAELRDTVNGPGWTDAKHIKAYKDFRTLVLKMGRLVDMHRRSMLPQYRKRKEAVLQHMRSLTVMDDKTFRSLYGKRSRLRARVRAGMSPADETAALRQLHEYEQEMQGIREETEEYGDLLTELDRLDGILAETSIRTREGYVPHKFFGTYALYRLVDEPVLDAAGQPTLDEAGEPITEPVHHLVAGEHGFYPTQKDAVDAAKRVARLDPETPLVVKPVQFKFPNSAATTLTDASYWALTANVASATGLSGQDLRDQMEGIARRRFRRRIAGFAQYRQGIEGFSTDMDKVMRSHVNELTRYVFLDKLKYRAINDMERMGMSPFRSANQKNPTLTKMVEAFLRDMNGQKQAGEESVDARLDKILGTAWGKPVLVGIPATAAGASLMFGIATNPMIAAAVSGYVGWRLYSSLSQGGEFKSRRLTQDLMSDMAHAKLGAIFNLGSAMVNLTQTAINTLPVLGPKYTMIGMIKLEAAMRSRMMGKPNEDYRLLERSDTISNDTYTETQLLEVAQHSLARLSLFFFRTTENFNRAVSFLGGYHRAKDRGDKPGPAFKEAEAAMGFTQHRYGGSNKAEALRNVFLRVPAQFKNYMMQQIAFTFELGRKGITGKSIYDEHLQIDRHAILVHLTSLFLVSGAIGLPFVALLSALIKGIFDYDPLDELKKAALEAQSSGKLAAGAWLTLVRGLPAWALGEDLSARAGMGEQFTPQKAADLAGPWYGTMDKAIALGELQAGFVDQLVGVSPGAGKPLKAIEAMANGMPIWTSATDTKAFFNALGDNKINWVSPWKNRPEFDENILSKADVVRMGLGSTPTKVAMARDEWKGVAEDVKLDRKKTQLYVNKIVSAERTYGHDDAKFEAAIGKIRKDMDAAGVTVKESSIAKALGDARTNRLERTIKGAPVKMRPDIARRTEVLRQQQDSQ